MISSKLKKKKHHAGQAFRIAATALNKSQSPLGDQYRMLKAKVGPAKAVVAMARKLAIIFYLMVTKKTRFQP